MARPRSFQEPDVLTRAMLVFWQSGFTATNVRQLEAATGLKASSLYHRFGSKEQLFHEVLDHYLDKVVGWRVRRYLLNQDDPLRGISLFLHSCYDYIDADRGRPAVACLLTNSALELGNQDSAVNERINCGMQRVRDGFADALGDARDAGMLDDNCDIARLADQLLLGLQGLLVHTKLTANKARLQQLADSLLTMIPGRPR